MDEFGSPIAGGINAVRRNVGSSMLMAPRNQGGDKEDSTTTNLLSQQSLQLSNVSESLGNIQTQVRGLGASLEGIKENLTLQNTIEEQREAAKQNRERVLAEQGLREGKESALEQKMQQALTTPLRKVAQKTQGILNNVFKSFLFLAGGWIVNKGIDILQAQAEGNTDKLNALKTQFGQGLLVIGGTVTAVTLGLKNIVNLLGIFATTVSKVAISGVLKASLTVLKFLFAGLVKKAAGIGLGFFTAQFAKQLLGFAVFDRVLKTVTGGFRKPGANIPLPGITQPKLPGSGVNQPKLNPSNFKAFSQRADEITAASKNVKPTGNFFSRTLQRGKNLLSSGTQQVAKSKTTKKGIFNIFRKFAKGGLAKFLGKLSGPLFPIIDFVMRLQSGQGVGEALAGAASYAIGFALGQAFIPIPIVGGLIGGFLGEQVFKGLKFLFKKFFGLFKGKDETETEGTSSNKDKNIKPLNGTNIGATVSQSELNMLNSGDAELINGKVVPIKKNQNVAEEISKIDEGAPVVVQMPNANENTDGGMVASRDDDFLPTITFDTSNPHTLYASALTEGGGA
tara:strand:+ start:185 stop:1882 length:1698 start_codon:yes stop_codon:yes gene_type:complete